MVNIKEDILACVRARMLTSDYSPVCKEHVNLADSCWV